MPAEGKTMGLRRALVPAPLSRFAPPRGASIPIAFAVFSLLLIGIGEALSPGYASAANMLQLLKLSSFLGIVSIGQTLVILAGGIDLSVAWVLTGAAFAFTTVTRGQNRGDSGRDCLPRWRSAPASAWSMASASPSSAFRRS